MLASPGDRWLPAGWSRCYRANASMRADLSGSQRLPAVSTFRFDCLFYYVANLDRAIWFYTSVR